MKDAKNFLIISLIVHVLVFIILACVVLPPMDTFKEFLESLSADFVELKPLVWEPESREDEVEQEQAEEAETPQVPKLPKLTNFSISIEEPISETIRTASSERRAVFRSVRSGKGRMSSQPLAMKPVPGLTDDSDIIVVPDLQKEGENIAGDSGEGFNGRQPKPASGGAGFKGQSTRFVSPFALSSPQRKNGNKFADILPDLAHGIVERATGKKMDVVFVIDATGSMRDNVRGVRDYIRSFLEPIKENNFDVALGLVEFTDLEIKKAKVIGLTKKEKKFRKWLDKTIFFGGTDLPESGYEALLDALEEIDFRKDAQRFFIFISDAPQHDLDYDGKSRYTLDGIVSKLNAEGIPVDVVGANHLPVKQLAWGTGGQWKHIPGGDPVNDIPYPASSMIRSRLERSLSPTLVEDRVTIEFHNSVPDWVDLSYKMLDPMGFKCLGTLTYRIKVLNKAENKVDFVTKIDLSKFKDQPGVYTLIYRVRDSKGNRDVLRRTLALRAADS